LTGLRVIDIFGPLKLRDNPLMRYRGLPNWPPVWTHAKRGSVKTVRGEVGVLQYVHSNSKVSGKCYLVIDYQHETYVGTLIFESRAFCKQVVDLLNLHLKKTIQAIGDLELPPP
jgi:hypothetical protein